MQGEVGARALEVVMFDIGDVAAIVVVGLPSPVMVTASSSFVTKKCPLGQLILWGCTKVFYLIAASSCCCGRRYGCAVFENVAGCSNDSHNVLKMTSIW